jgi:UDP-glucuronate decarboxylase
MRNTALVAGGGGFLGSHLCESLLNDGYTVCCVDNFGSGRFENVAHLSDEDRFSVIRADIRNDPELPYADEIFHLASRASPTDFTEFPVRIALTNTEGTRHLLDHAVDCNATMLYASTSEVYGDPTVHPQPESYTGNVNIRGPRGCYDESKRFGETLTVAYLKKYNLDVRTVRLFNTYGPRMRPDDGRVVPTFVKQALNGDDLTVYGDGTQTRSFCYSSDTVRGIRAIMEADGLQGDVLNIGKQNEIPINKLANTILDIVDTDSGLLYEPLPEDDPQRRCPDINKAKRLLNWEPSIQLEEGLRKTIEFFEESK